MIDDDDQRTISFGNKLSILATISGFIGTIIVASFYVSRVESRVEMTEHRLGRVEVQQREDIAQGRQDRDILIELRTDVKAIKEALKPTTR